ncbi:MAG: hypothetical protein QM831_17890 [Kofleriaceae bacterium]
MQKYVIAALVAASGCGYQIGDSCIVSSDCQADGTRVCDLTQREGYCTIIGCDYDTCPDNSECVAFFSGGGWANKPCDPTTEDKPSGGTNDCSVDELCSLENQCVPRSSETRYCMKTCDSDADCRDHYECRDINLMIEHGGEPVLNPTDENSTIQNAAHFCAMAID